MVWTLTTSGSATSDAGANVNADIKASGSTLENWSDQVESDITSIANIDVVTGFSDFKNEGKQVLSQLASNMIAQKMINHDMSGYTSRAESLTMLNVLENRIVKNQNLIKDDKVKTLIGAT